MKDFVYLEDTEKYTYKIFSNLPYETDFFRTSLSVSWGYTAQGQAEIQGYEVQSPNSLIIWRERISQTFFSLPSVCIINLTEFLIRRLKKIIFHMQESEFK